MSTDQYYDSDVQRTLSEHERELGFGITFGAEDDVNELSWSPNPNEINSSPELLRSSGANRERKRQSVSDNLEEAKGKGTKKGRTLDSGQSSVSHQRKPERREKDIKELVEKKPLLKVIKVLDNRVYRRIKKEKMADMESVIILFSSIVEKFLGLSVDLNLIQRRRPVRSDLKNIVREIEETTKEIKENKGTGMEETDKMKQRLIDIEEMIKKYDEQKCEVEAKVKNLVPFFTDENVGEEIQREKLCSEFPWLFGKEIAANRPTANKDQGSLQTREQLQSIKDLKDLESRIFAEDRIVKVSDFPGLQEEREKTTSCGSNVPDCLKHIAIKIEKARGEATPFHCENLAILVCAAIQGMEDTPVEKLNLSMLLTWGATLKSAREFKFQVDFAEDLLRKNLYSYYVRSKLEKSFRK